MKAQLHALHAVVLNPQLRRLELAWMWTALAVWGGLLALSVYAYEHGGPAAVGVMALLRALPGAPAAPFLSLLVDRMSRRRVMIGSALVRAGIMLAVAGAVAADAPIWVVYVLVAALAVAGPAFRPALTALTPRAARTPAELSSAAVASSLLSNAGFLGGSVLVGLLLGPLSMEAVFALLGGAFAAAAVPLLRVERDRPPERDPHEAALSEVVAGWRAVRKEPGLAEPVLLGASLYFVDGALDVLVVVAALGFLDVGEAGAGVLNAAWAAGCIAGGAVVLALLGRGRLTLSMLIGALILGPAVILIGLTDAFAVALTALILFGVGFTLVDVAATTLLQRLAPDHVLGRVGGITEGATVTAAAFGSLAGGLLADAFGARAAFVVVGVLFPAVALVRHARLAGLEAGSPVSEREYQLLRAHPIFAPLSVAEAERLARALRECRPCAGDAVITEGEPGDSFYLVAEGELDIYERGEHCAVRGPGEGVGEIALLRDVPRMATVRARDGVVLLALDRDDFLGAVASQVPAGRAAHRIADERQRRD